MTQKHRLRHEIYRLLESPTGSGRLRQSIDRGLITLIVVNALLMLLDDVATQPWEDIFYAIEVLSVGLFTIEYICRVWVAVEQHELHKRPAWRVRLHYMGSVGGLIDIAAILPFYLGAIIPVDLRYLRLLRLFRLLKLSRYSPALQSLAAAFYQERRSFAGALLIVIVVLLTSASAMHLAEHEAQPQAFGTLLDSMWWAIITLTTVGYGDVVPHTPAGKVIAGISALLGLGLFALPTAILASSFVEQIKRRDFVVNAKLVNQVPLFKNVGVMHMVEIASMLKPLTVPPFYTVVRAGDPADCMYFILTGELEVGLSPRPVRLSAGDFFGEMGLINHAPRSATVIAVTDTQLLMLEESDFHKLMQLYPDMRQEIESHAEIRSRKTKAKVEL